MDLNAIFYDKREKVNIIYNRSIILIETKTFLL